jgi:CubicO group peptidase (beta-lactamase class C family)
MLGAVALLVVACSSDDDNVSEEPAATVSSTSSTSAATRPTTTPTTTPDDAAGGDILAGGVTRDQVMAAVAQIDGLVEAEMQRSEVPGIAVAVVHDDEVVFAEGYGVREVGTQDPVSPETVFQLASLSKPISATAVARLVFKGVIDWDDPVRSSAPELVFSDPWVTDHITFADLYSHRSGLPGQAGNALETIGFTRDEILARLRYVPLEPFRATYSYSNFGLTAAGDAAANAAGVRFEDVMDELFDLAGMTASSARYADFEAQPDRATIHNIVDGEWVPGPTRNPDAQAPAGGISSSLNDVATWVRLQLGAGTLDGVEIVGEEALAATHAPHIVNRPAETYDGQHGSYGLGWTLATDHLGELRWAHSGAFSQGAHTSVTLLPQEQLGVVVLSNAMPVGSAEAIADQIIDQIIVGEQTQDWAEVWSARYSNLFVADETLAEPPVPATPALPDDAYVGSYANEYYGTFEVIADGDGLAVVQGPAGVEFALTHWDANTFTWISDPELPEVRSRFEFTVDPDGRATAITIPAAAAGLGTLQRV